MKPAAIKALEAVVTTGILPPADALQRVKSLAQLSYQIKDYPAVVAHAERYYKAGGNDPEPRLLMAQAYFLQNDFADAAKISRSVLADGAKAGTAPSESVRVTIMPSSTPSSRNA